MTDNKASLRVAETDPKFVGRGIALVDQRITADLDLKTGDVIEISGTDVRHMHCCGQVNNLILVRH